jgi:hypothetical protein
MKVLRLLSVFSLFLLSKGALGVDPSVSVYIDHVSYTSSKIMEFDIMMKANGSTSSFQLRTFQAGLYVNPAWVNGGTLTAQNVSTYTQMSGLGYNGSFQWNATDKLINCSVNFDVLGPTTCIYTAMTTTAKVITRIRVTNSVNFTCNTPDIKFNYVSNISPLRLRTSFSWREVACTTNYDMFYPGRTYGGSATFNGEVYTSSDADGKSPAAASGNTGFCSGELKVTALIEGFYDPYYGALNPDLYYCNVLHAQTEQADTITVELRPSSSTTTVHASFKTILHADGVAYCIFPLGAPLNIPGNSFWIVVKHRNTIETWSSAPVLFSNNTEYNFSDNVTKAYGSNMVQVDVNKWAFYSGDISDAATGLPGIQDGVVESQDYADMENAVSVILTGYVYADITGDGVVESTDYSILENNVSTILFTIHP